VINKHPLQFTKTAVEFDTGNLVLGRILQAISPAKPRVLGILGRFVFKETTYVDEAVDAV